MPPLKKRKTEANNPSPPEFPSIQESTQRALPPPPPAAAPILTDPFNFFGLPRELRDMIYAHYLPYNDLRIVTIGSAAFSDGTMLQHMPLWSIRMRPTISIDSVLVSRQFCAEALRAFLSTTTVVLRMHKAATREFALSSEYLAGAPASIVVAVKPLVRRLTRCRVHIDVTELQHVIGLQRDLTMTIPDDPEGTMRSSVARMKGRLFEALGCMASLVELKVEILRTKAQVERYMSGIAEIGELRRVLRNLGSVRVVFTDRARDEVLVHQWQRDLSLRTG